MNTKTNNDWIQHPHFAALDWASDHHDVVLVDRSGALVAEFRFAHTAAGWAQFTETMKPYAGAPLALETSSGPAVDQLLQRRLDALPGQPQGGPALPRTQSPQRHQDRPPRRLEAWPTPCAPTVTAGARSARKTRPPPPCAPSAATRSR